ncbi:hypothetical protein [Mesorhizobium sp.]|uniref:hypothetical protein n=1 Tax=Mesorhizobium sp. TaxID=1871066 RepID=UPI0025B93FE5|nr:hypothetical protein [Mesorhizobium sp.]
MQMMELWDGRSVARIGTGTWATGGAARVDCRRGIAASTGSNLSGPLEKDIVRAVPGEIDLDLAWSPDCCSRN